MCVLSTEDIYTTGPPVSAVLSSHLLFKGTLDGCSQGVLNRGKTACSVTKDTWKIHCEYDLHMIEYWENI